jgi:glycosyltransferase involved in cell wall biosynthesis
MPSYYESFGRIGVEAMYNGIPVLYSTPTSNTKYPGGSTEGMEEWITPAGISCDREKVDEWMNAIVSLDNEEDYVARSDLVRAHIQSLNLFTEGSRIAGLVEQFVREHPVKIQTPRQQMEAQLQTPQQVATRIVQPVGQVGFSNGRLRIKR